MKETTERRGISEEAAGSRDGTGVADDARRSCHGMPSDFNGRWNSYKDAIAVKRFFHAFFEKVAEEQE